MSKNSCLLNTSKGHALILPYPEPNSAEDCLKPMIVSRRRNQLKIENTDLKRKVDAVSEELRILRQATTKIQSRRDSSSPDKEAGAWTVGDARPL